MRNRFESFAGCVMELYRSLQRIKDIEMRKLGLRAGDTMCLYYLSRSDDGMTSGELCEACREDKAAVSRTLSELAKKGLIVSEASRGGRAYRAKLRLTDEGQCIAEKMNVMIRSALDCGGAGLDDGEREAFYTSMELILQNLEKYVSEEGSHEPERGQHE